MPIEESVRFPVRLAKGPESHGRSLRQYHPAGPNRRRADCRPAERSAGVRRLIGVPVCVSISQFREDSSREDLTVSIVVCRGRPGGTFFRLPWVRCRRCCGPTRGTAAPPADEKGPPLPFITIEGTGGGAFTPMAYLVNPAGECDVWGKPSVATDYIGLGRKNLNSMMVTENLLGRVEFGFAADRLGLGTLPYDINRTVATSAADIPVNNSDVWLYNFSVRGLAGEGELRRPAMDTGRHPGRHAQVQRRH